MGIKEIIVKNNLKLGIWRITESLTQLLTMLKKESVPINLKQDWNSEKRKKEFLITRLLLHNMSPRTIISYNKFGAPELNNSQKISIAHTKELAVIILSNKKVGLDIEQISAKSLKISSKFITQDIGKNLSKEEATLIWSAKEAIYKWYQKGKINFIKDIKLHDFEINYKGTLKAEFKNEMLLLNYQKINNHYLVYVCK